MIYLPDIASSLEDILNNRFNGQNEENPTSFLFKVATVGFHLDKIYNKSEQKNFIPVFIDAMGGNYDAVKNIKRAVKNITVTFYFPVRFKNDFFAMDDFFVENFVAEIVDFGGITGKCLCNTSVPQIGEIQELDLNQFANWVNTLYGLPIEKMEAYMSMTFTLYLTTQSSDFILGNSVSYNLSYSLKRKTYTYVGFSGLTTMNRNASLDKEIDGVEYFAWGGDSWTPNTTYYTKTSLPQSNDPYYTIENNVVTLVGNLPELVIHGNEVEEEKTYSEDLVWTSSGTGVSNSPISQQLVDVDEYTKNTINITNYNKSIVAYIKNTVFWINILDYYNKQNINHLYNFKLNKKYNFGAFEKDYDYDQVVLSLNENVALGDLISMTITFGDKYDVEE